MKNFLITDFTNLFKKYLSQYWVLDEIDYSSWRMVTLHENYELSQKNSEELLQLRKRQEAKILHLCLHWVLHSRMLWKYLERDGALICKVRWGRGAWALDQAWGSMQRWSSRLGYERTTLYTDPHAQYGWTAANQIDRSCVGSIQNWSDRRVKNRWISVGSCRLGCKGGIPHHPLQNIFDLRSTEEGRDLAGWAA
jgi:hypothetical protein